MFRKTSRMFFRVAGLCIPLYIMVMLLLAGLYIDNPQLAFPSQVSANIPNPFGGGDSGNTSNYSQIFDQFEAFVFVASATEVSGHDLKLFALPGQRAKIYRNFSIYIFSNQPCFYQIKIDDQVYARGHTEWKAKIMADSPYSKMDIEVQLINETNASLPLFNFNNINLLDSPWDAVKDEDEGGAEHVEEWIRFSQGEFTTFIFTRILTDIIFAFLGIAVGTSAAAIRADTMGIVRVI